MLAVWFECGVLTSSVKTSSMRGFANGHVKALEELSQGFSLVTPQRSLGLPSFIGNCDGAGDGAMTSYTRPDGIWGHARCFG